jgi:hypothetical protein
MKKNMLINNPKDTMNIVENHRFQTIASGEIKWYCEMETKEREAIEENERLRKENEELLRYIFRLGCQFFTQTDSYRKLEEKKNKKCFNSEERRQLHIEIHSAFTKLVQIIRKACPDLTNEDIVFCCLSQFGLDSSAICRCMGNVNTQPVNQRRYRIKKKMKERKCDALFDWIFNYNQYENE